MRHCDAIQTETLRKIVLIFDRLIEREGERARERDDALDNFSKKSLAGDVIITMINAFRLDHVTSKFCRENENEKYKKYVLNKLKIGFLPFLADGVFRYFEATA